MCDSTGRSIVIDSVNGSKVQSPLSLQQIDVEATASLAPVCNSISIPSRLIVTRNESVLPDIKNDTTTMPAVTTNTTGSIRSGTNVDHQTAQPSDQSTIATIRIVEREKQLLQVLNDVTEQYNRNIDINTLHHCDTSSGTESFERKLIVRIAGGWVRDKVLGFPYDQNTNDIDIAINTLTGVQFAKLVQSYVLESSPPNHPPHNDDSLSAYTGTAIQPNLHKMGIIAANPEQSKHLETACLKLYDIDIDFTNLRCHEVYSNPDNRIPDITIQFGTPQSDAYRRDFTINALYYNIETAMIEDYTQLGLIDLHNRCLRTPLDPHVTFADDPLRILRAIRFAKRFHLTMDGSIIAAAQDLSIQKALRNKVSRERVGKELEGMLSGKGANPIEALQTIHQLHLSSCIFTLPTIGLHCTRIYGTFLGSSYELAASYDTEIHSNVLNHWDESLSLLSILQSAWELHDVMVRQQQSGSPLITETSQLDRRLLPLATYLLPFGQLQYTEIPKNNAATVREWKVVAFILKDSIKSKNSDVQAMTTIMNNIDSMIQLLTKYNHARLTEEDIMSKDTDFRLEVGTILCDTKELWVTVLLLAALSLTRRCDALESHRTNEDVELKSTSDTSEQVDWLRISHTVYYDIVHNLKLDHCWNTIRPIMNGQELIRELNLPKGPTVGLYMEEQMKYLLRYPTSTKEECLQYLAQLDTPLVSPTDIKSNKKKKTRC